MALQDILDAIIAQADQKIADARSQQQRELTAKREETERRISKKKQEIAKQKEEKKEQLMQKAKTHASMRERNAELLSKQEQLDVLYSSVVDELGKAPDGKVEDLLRACLKQISEDGTIHPSKKHEDLLKKLAPSEQFKMGSTIESAGGFRFESKKQEFDFTFEHLVHDVLRPQTELETAHTLFA